MRCCETLHFILLLYVPFNFEHPIFSKDTVKCAYRADFFQEQFSHWLMALSPLPLLQRALGRGNPRVQGRKEKKLTLFCVRAEQQI